MTIALPRCHSIAKIQKMSCRVYQAGDVSIAIPTFGRDEILVDTIRACIDLTPQAGEILVVDQTPGHDPGTEETLTSWESKGIIRWIRLPNPSVPAAMNHALQNATKPLVLFLDDDVVPEFDLIAAHAAAHTSGTAWGVVGQIIQPWQVPEDVPYHHRSNGLRVDLDFPFHSTRRAELRNAMAGHLSVNRERAIDVGGFDENFKGAAYRFETEFARRLIASGGHVLFEPTASIRHLRAERGGTRQHGNHLTSCSPHHGVGDYYFAMLNGCRLDVIAYVMHRLIREVCTRFHLQRPWYIPIKLCGEIRALCWALTLLRSGPALLRRALP